MKYSAIWITKNEEQFLADSIESIKDGVDQLVVVDTGSTDKTVEIAQSYGAEVYHFEWIDDFAAARNFAISKASGDIIYFLDADECFKPKIDADIRIQMSKFFEDPDADVIFITINNIDNDTNLSKGTAPVARIFRNREDLYYIGRIHESLSCNGNPLENTRFISNISILHYGYSQSIFAKKLERNVVLLKQVIANPNNAMEEGISHYYIAREYVNQGKIQDAFEHVEFIATHPQTIDLLCHYYATVFPQFFFMAIEVYSKMRNKTSRKMVFNNIVIAMEEKCPTYPGTKLIRPLYYALLDNQEDLLLNSFAEANQYLQNTKRDPNDAYCLVWANLYVYCANALWRRGERIEAMDYAVKALQTYPILFDDVLRILLSVIKDQPPTEIISFLYSIMELDKPIKIIQLIRNLQLEGLREVYIFFVRKLIETGKATKGDYLFTLLLSGNMEESIDKALKMNDQANQEMVARHLFICAIISQDSTFYQQNKQLLVHYQVVLDAFFEGRQLTEMSMDTINIYANNYQSIAFVAGQEVADRLTYTYQLNTKLCFVVRSKYLQDNERYADILAINTDNLDHADSSIWPVKILAHLRLGQVEQAYHLTSRQLEEGYIEQVYLQLMLIVAEKAQGYLKDEADNLHKKYQVFFDELVEIMDLVNTKYCEYPKSKKQNKGMAALTIKQFDDNLQELAQRYTPVQTMHFFKQAGQVYVEKEAYALAYQLYSRLLAHNHEPGACYERLLFIFNAVKNRPLIAHCQTKLLNQING